MTCGIYFIKNVIEDKYYIGRSKNIEQRIINHLNDMGKPTNSNITFDLIKSHNPPSVFEYGVIEECHPDKLDELEMKWVKELNTLYPNGYNETVGNMGYDTYANNPLQLNDYKEKFSKIKKDFYDNMNKDEISLFYHSLPNPVTGKKWWTNGKEEILSFERPDGYWKGRKPSSIACVEEERKSDFNGEYHPRIEFKSEFIDTSGMDVQVLDNGSWSPVLKFIYNNKHVSEDFMCVEYENENGKTSYFECTIDHPLVVNGFERKRADELTTVDTLVSTTSGKNLKIKSTFKIEEKRESYDLETDSDTFDCSGIRSHNCRTLVISDNLVRCNQYEEPSKKYKFDRESYPPYAIAAGRGNFSFVTLNLPRYAIESSNKYDELEPRISYFYRLLLKNMLLAKNILQEKQKIIGDKLDKDFQFIVGEGLVYGSNNLEPGEKTNKLWEHSSKSIGYIGIYEVIKTLYNSKQLEKEQEAIDIVTFMRKMLDCMSKGYYIIPTSKGLKDNNWYKEIFNINESTNSRKNNTKSNWDEKFQVFDIDNNPILINNKNNLRKGNWSLFATPAESACKTFNDADLRKFGELKDVTDKGYYTNSNHVDVREQVNAVEKIKYEASFHTLTNAGNISYIEMDGLVSKNLNAYKKILNEMHDNEMGYCAINIPLDVCPVCRYRGEIPEGEPCPMCGNDESNGGEPVYRTRRITGYLVPGGTLGKSKGSRMNQGKRFEVKNRVKHVKVESL